MNFRASELILFLNSGYLSQQTTNHHVESLIVRKNHAIYNRGVESTYVCKSAIFIHSMLPHDVIISDIAHNISGVHVPYQSVQSGHSFIMDCKFT